MEVFVLGAGSFAREVADMARDLGWEVAAFVVDVDGQPFALLGRPVIHAELLRGDGVFVAGLVSPARRVLAGKAEDRGLLPCTLVHPSASVSRTALVERGALISRLVAVGDEAEIGRLAILNRGALVGHGCVVGIAATVGPGANLAGGSVVGRHATVGMGALLLEGRKIGAWATVGAGSVVTRDVPDGETWWGSPARRMR